MENTIKSLKQELIDTIARIDKVKLTIVDLKTLSETVAVLSTIKEDQMDYMDLLLKMMPFCGGIKPPIIEDMKGAEE